MKRLLILRHAKSDWSAAYGGDHERPLNTRGVRAARSVGVAVARSAEIPDVAVTSSATRARTTLEEAMDAGDWKCRVVTDPRLYGTSPPGALAVAAETPDDVERLMLVGHQPAWGALIGALTGASVVMKTATLTAVDLRIATWADAPRADGSIAYLLQPRLFTEGSWELL